jgi:transcriptional regulator with XRE-family HTH domain
MGNDLRAVRMEANLTLKEVAGTLGRSFEWLRQIEIGQRQVRPEILSRIRKVLSSLKQMKDAERSQRLELNSNLGLSRVAARPRTGSNI